MKICSPYLPLMPLAVAIALSFAGCGGGGDSAAPSAAGTATNSTKTVASGRVTGFGSIIVDGVRYDDSHARVQTELDSSSPRASPVSDVRLGMQVEVSSRDGSSADSLSISAEVIARISSLRSDGFVVAGQNVIVVETGATATVFDGVSGLAGLKVNDLVEVHGQRDANGAIQASRVERQGAPSSSFARVVGTVSAFDASNKQFSISGLTVRYDDNTRILGNGAALADGVRVAVFSTAAPAGNAVQATTIVVKHANAGQNDRARVGGTITDLDAAKQKFSVNGFSVDASQARFDNGSASDLANGAQVRINGAMKDGVLVATEVRFARSNDSSSSPTELRGAITDFVSAASFKVRGVTIDASGAGIEFKNGTLASLSNGVQVKIEGATSGNVVKPRQIEIVALGNGGGYYGNGGDRGRGSSGGGSGSGGGNGSGGSNGSSGHGNDDVTDGSPSSVGASGLAHVEGLVYDLDAGAGTFKINGVLVSVNATNSYYQSLTQVENGMIVEVTGTVVNGSLVASKLEVQSANNSPALTVEVRGPISDFVSTGDFRVSGQRVDAGSATFVNGVAADLADDRVVEVHGTVVDTVLKATSVELK